jgi:hypothetical protein
MKMQKPKLRPVALFLLTLIGAGSIALGFRGKSHERYAEEKAKHNDACVAWVARGGAAEACDVNVVSTKRPKLFPMYNEARSQIRMARAAIAMGFEANIGVPTLGAALDVAMKLDRHGTPLAEIMAAALVDEVLNAIEGKAETHPLLPPKAGTPPLSALPINTKAVESSSALRKVLSGRHEFRSARRPLEGERLYALTSIESLREESAKAPVAFRGSFASATAADLMRDYASTSRAMEAAILRGDEAQCHAAAAGGPATATSVNPANRWIGARFGVSAHVLCPKMIEAVRTAKRFEKVRRERLSIAS